MYTYHVKNTRVPEHLRLQAFVAGHARLFAAVTDYPDLRMVDIKYVMGVRAELQQLGYRTRIRYRGPHKQHRDTVKHCARAFTVYFKEQ
jgi:hypothetical protein